MTFEQWTNAAGTLGVPAVILAAMGFAGWKAAWWFANEVIKPVSTRHITFLDTLERLVGEIAVSSDRICEQLDTQNVERKIVMDKFDLHNRGVIDRLDTHGKKLDDLHQIVRQK